MDNKVRALCIKSSAYKEKDKLLTLLSVERGRLQAVAKSSTSPSSKLKLATAPLCFGEYILTKSATGRFVVTGCSIEDSFFNCWSDVNRLTSAQIVLELLDCITLENDENVSELVLALKAISAINYNPVYPFINSAWFIVNSLKGMGVDLEIEAIPERLKGITLSLGEMTTDNLDGLELTINELRYILTYLEAVLKRTLGKKINSLEIAIGTIEEVTVN